MPADRLAKRSAAQERLRGGFLSGIGPQIQELAALLSDGTDEGRDSALAELERIARTAGALGIEGLSEAASGAVDVERQVPAQQRLEPVARAMRQILDRPLFGPIGIVGDEDLIGRFRKMRNITPEPLRIATHLEGLRDPLSVVPWTALLVPVEQVDEAMKLADGAPVIGWGESRDWEARLRDAGLEILQSTTAQSPSGPASFVVVDPDGNPVLIDQHR